MPAALDVSEATRALRKDKTAIVQCADGQLCFLRDVTESEVQCEPLDGGEERTLPTASLKLLTGYDSDEDGLKKDVGKRQRTAPHSTSAGPSSSALTSATPAKERTAVERMLCKAYPFVSPHGTAELEASLRHLEKFELVLQGDDWADKECLATNSEALQYARARAVVKGLTWSLSSSLKARGPMLTIQRLMDEPFVGESNATKIVELLKTGTCQRTLARFQRSEAPLDSQGNVRTSAHRHEQSAVSRRMTGGVAKLELSSALCISAIKAGKLVDDPIDPILSIAELRARPDKVAEGGIRLQHSLRYHEELQEPVPADDAQAMLSTVQEIVRALHIPRPEGWHAEFVGGGRTRGKAGHDVDILLSHAEEMASFRQHEEAEPVFVLKLLLDELVRRGLVLPKSEAYHSPKYERNRHQTPRPYLKSPHMANETSKGYENLHHDHHDKFFGIWRSARTRKHHRVDIVVCSHPDELPFARLGWTGTRLLNRTMRLRAIELGLYLGAHCFVARGDRPGTSETEVVVEARPGRQRETVTLQKLEHLPFEYVRSEEDILRVLACGTDDFCQLVEPMKRNA